MKWFRIITLFLPTVFEVVRIIEGMFRGKPGAFKKESAMRLLKSIWDNLAKSPDIKIKEIKDIPFDSIGPMVDFMIDLSVNTFNESEEFTHEVA